MFISIKDSDKPAGGKLAVRLISGGFEILATSGTARYFAEIGISVTPVKKVREGRPHCVDALLNGDIQLVINTTEGADAITDSFSIRRSALSNNVPHYTTMTGAAAAVEAIEAQQAYHGVAGLEVTPLQSYSIYSH